jgi:hypothetical protein
MLVVIAIGGLAVALIASSAVLSSLGERTLARTTVLVGLVFAVAAAGLAVAAEVQYRQCINSFQPGNALPLRGEPTAAECKRWPFSNDP